MTALTTEQLDRVNRLVSSVPGLNYLEARDRILREDGDGVLEPLNYYGNPYTDPTFSTGTCSLTFTEGEKMRVFDWVIVRGQEITTAGTILARHAQDARIRVAASHVTEVTGFDPDIDEIQVRDGYE